MDKEIQHYSSGSKLLHWLIAIIVILMLSLSFFLVDLPKADQPTAYLVHKSFGLTVFLLMMIRIIWIGLHKRPRLPDVVPYWQRILARSVQYGLYVLVPTMALTGWIMSVAADKVPYYFGLFHVPLPIVPNKPLAIIMNQMHKTIALILIGLISLHILGSLKHYFIDKDNVLQSMLPRKPMDKRVDKTLH